MRLLNRTQFKYVYVRFRALIESNIICSNVNQFTTTELLFVLSYQLNRVIQFEQIKLNLDEFIINIVVLL